MTIKELIAKTYCRGLDYEAFNKRASELHNREIALKEELVSYHKRKLLYIHQLRQVRSLLKEDEIKLVFREYKTYTEMKRRNALLRNVRAELLELDEEIARMSGLL